MASLKGGLKADVIAGDRHSPGVATDLRRFTEPLNMPDALQVARSRYEGASNQCREAVPADTPFATASGVDRNRSC